MASSSSPSAASSAFAESRRATPGGSRARSSLPRRPHRPCRARSRPARRARRRRPRACRRRQLPSASTDRRARLHPERPVRRVLPGRSGRLLRRGGADGHVPERDRREPRAEGRPGDDRSRPVRRHERHPGGQPGRADQVGGDDLREVPLDRVRQGEQRDHRRRRPGRQEAGDPRQVRLVVDHAPGAARLEAPHGRRPDDRRVPRLRPGRRGRPGRRRRGDRLRQQRADPAGARGRARSTSSGSTT